jgi:hypothetical protein
MAGLAAAVRPNDRRDPAIGMMIGAMTPAAIEQDETDATQQRLHFAEVDARWRPAHPGHQLVGRTHAPSSSFCSAIVEAASRGGERRWGGGHFDSPGRSEPLFPRAMPLGHCREIHPGDLVVGFDGEGYRLEAGRARSGRRGSPSVAGRRHGLGLLAQAPPVPPESTRLALSPPRRPPNPARPGSARADSRGGAGRGGRGTEFDRPNSIKAAEESGCGTHRAARRGRRGDRRARGRRRGCAIRRGPGRGRTARSLGGRRPIRCTGSARCGP